MAEVPLDLVETNVGDGLPELWHARLESRPVHRRFANRQALLEALAVSAKQQLIDAIEQARPDAAPALVALCRVTANVLRVKGAWRFTLSHATAHTEAAAALWAEIDAHSVTLLTRAQREGASPRADVSGR